MKKKLFLLGIFLLAVLGGYFLHPFFLDGMGRFLIVRDPLGPADLIIVISGDSSGERVAEGVRLFKEGRANKILMSGGPLSWKLTAAAWMKKQAVAQGVPARAVFLEERSSSTIENAEFSLPVAQKLGAKTCILVTSPSHSRRAKRVFKKVFGREDFKIISSPVRLGDSDFKLERWWTRHMDTRMVMWEYVSMAYYFLKRY